MLLDVDQMLDGKSVAIKQFGAVSMFTHHCKHMIRAGLFSLSESNVHIFWWEFQMDHLGWEMLSLGIVDSD